MKLQIRNARAWLLLATLPLMLGAAQCDSPEQRSTFDRVNSYRAARGLPTLGYDGGLAAGADGFAEEMAAGAKPFAHPPIASWCDFAKYTACGENLGMGGSLDQIHTALDQSPLHHAVMNSRDYTVLGVGYATAANGTIYVVHRYARPL